MAKKTTVKSSGQPKTELTTANRVIAANAQNNPSAAAETSGGTVTGNGASARPEAVGNGNGDSGNGHSRTVTVEQIAARAYEIYEREGRSEGRAMDHWLRAEAELRTETLPAN